MSQIKLTQRLKDALDLLREVDISRFEAFLDRVMTGLTLRNQQIFTVEEYAKLENVFGLAQSDLQLLVQSCAYLFEQVAIKRISNFEGELVALGVPDEYIDGFLNVWDEQGPAFLAALKEKTYTAPVSLAAIDWKLDLPISSNTEAPQGPEVRFNFEMSNSEKLEVRFSRSELHRFFMDLELIQEQIDKLI
mmetsp:Transcript_32814/g.57218  ORF Transcript_32814/g.57218 Transcript_32814/m.57218 type:complete len:191 (-) Transcript_32814:339-911(-)|eukprot:CAMPEP_0204917472 /NCGR_PEP_ID=MMETSP1397-20131031/15067_1 /ASSEMBLY_ACC=CAM_ASM_000891 /TAXON_ID=49980 /ORGANISM="Climacostomum Climacostomum virens, Strain Stock W-24" /LENGTH=190 /DNA_ID=CAMNT_0052090317 /DNA_START=816 /DNA_END=1388 /DNA_ORIENTATION=-